jgi:hypothetical protein
MFARFAKGVLSLITDEVMCLSIIEDMEYRFSQDLREKGRLRAEISRSFQFVIIVVPLVLEAASGGVQVFPGLEGKRAT